MNRGVLGFERRGRDEALLEKVAALLEREAADGRSPFPPLADYIAWYDAANPASFTLVSDLVSQWNDRSANARHLTQGTSGRRPGYGAARLRKIGGIVVPDFDGGDLLLHSTFPAAAPLTYLMVAENDTVAAFKVLISGSSAGAQPELRWNSGNPGGLNLVRTSSGAGSSVDLGFVQIAEPYLVAGLCDTAQWRGYFEPLEPDMLVNSGASTHGVTLTGSTGMVVGAQAGATNGLNGGLGELLIYDRILSEDEVVETFAYFREKWGFPK